jgi:hypothetical protein
MAASWGEGMKAAAGAGCGTAPTLDADALSIGMAASHVPPKESMAARRAHANARCSSGNFLRSGKPPLHDESAGRTAFSRNRFIAAAYELRISSPPQ